MKLSVALLAVSSLALACESGSSDGGGGTDSGAEGTDGADGASANDGNDAVDGADGTDTASDACTVPTGATVLANYRVYATEPDESSYVARNLVADGATVHVAFSTRVMKLSQAGGDPAEIYRATDFLGLSMWGLSAGGVIMKDGIKFLDDALTPIDYPEAVHPLNGLNAPKARLVLPNGDQVARFDDVDDTFAASVTHWVLLKQGAASQEVLHQNVSAGWGRTMIFAADAIYTNEPTLSTLDNPPPDRIVRLGLTPEGKEEILTIPNPGPVVAATKDFIYYNRDPNAPPAELGLWRAPQDGSASEKLGGNFGGFYGVVDAGRVAFSNGSSLYIIDDAPGAKLEKLLDLPVRTTIDHSCSSHTLALSANEVISTMFDDAQNATLIFKITAP